MTLLLAGNFRRSTLLSIVCLAFLLGIGFSHSLIVSSYKWAVFFGLIGLLFIRRSTLGALIILVVFGFCLGSCRGSDYYSIIQKYERLYNQKIEITGKVLSDAVYGKNGQLSFDISNTSIGGQNLVGKIGVAGFGENMIYQGDVIKVTGKLRPGKGSYVGWISYGVIETQSHGGTIIDVWRRNLGSALASTLPEPLGPFGMGLLIGQRNTLPDTTTKSLLHVGLVHIIAVSGYNLTILIKAVRFLFKRGSKYQVTVLSFCLIGIFLLFAGNSPSIVRAAIISAMSLFAWYYGRNLSPILMILLAAAITAFANPAYVWSDSGWYLSFLAFIGVVIVAPIVQKRLPDRVSRSLIGSMIVETLCAEIMTMPYVLYIFGQTSLVSLPANMLIATFVPIAMLFTIIAGVAGLVLPSLAGWLAWPATSILNYMLDGCALLNKIPGIFIDNHYLQTTGLFIAYATSLFLVLTMARYISRKVVQ